MNGGLHILTVQHHCIVPNNQMAATSALHASCIGQIPSDYCCLWCLGCLRSTNSEMNILISNFQRLRFNK